MPNLVENAMSRFVISTEENAARVVPKPSTNAPTAGT